MSADRDSRLYQLFQQACDLPAKARAAFLDNVCSDDVLLRAELERLLAQEESDSGVLDQPVGTDPQSFAAAIAGVIPTQIDKYRILRVLGQGGMGIVYLAEQDSPHRRVALKVLAPGLATRSMLARFALEADVLARLQHPCIAQVYDSGTAEIAGATQPYFAMEYVEGQTLLEYAETQTLDDAARLDLISQLCEAVHHAHQKGVIHRDLKPANILVTNDNQLKVLDFGIARLTDSDIKTTTLRTSVGELIGTIPYMSPEQTGGDSRDLDTRSDVYALGIITYQLLSGQLPYDLEARMIHEAIRIVRDQTPTPLSSITPRLRGDVETIVNKALEKEPARRYQSAQAFADDIERFLHNEPISARPPSVIYQMQKFARRNSLLVVSALAIVGILVAGVVGMSVLSLRIKHQRDTAVDLRRQAEEAQKQAEFARGEAEQAVEVQAAISGFLQDVFAAGSPYVGSKDMTVAQALDLAADRVQEKLAAHPEAAIAVRMRLSDTYFSLGKLNKSVEQTEAALQTALAASPPNLLDIILARAMLGQLYQQLGKAEPAKEQLEAAMKLIHDPTVRDPSVRALVMVNFGALLIEEERYEESIPILEECLRIRAQELGKDHPYTMTVRNNLAFATRRFGSLDAARKLSEENMASQLRSLGEEHPNTITGVYNHADLLREMGEVDESETLFRRCIELGIANLPTHHYMLGKYRSGYGELLRAAKRFEDAEPALEEGYQILNEQLGPQHKDTIRALDRLIQLYDDWGRPEQAEKWRKRSSTTPDSRRKSENSS